MKIAQRFNAGMYATPEQVPKGRLKDGANGYTFNRSFGTQILRTSFPALKRRATLAMSLRNNCSRYDLGISVRHSPKPQGLGKYFGGVSHAEGRRDALPYSPCFMSASRRSTC